MRSLTPSHIAALAALITLFSVFGLALAVQHQLADATSDSPMPATARRWLWRIELLLRLAALLATGVGIFICLFALRAGEAHPRDFRAVTSLLTVLFVGLSAHAGARIVLPRLWSRPSEDHLAPRLREDERDWVVGLVLVSFPFASSLPALIYADRVLVGLLLLIVMCAALLAVYLVLMGAARRWTARSTIRSRDKRDRRLAQVGLKLEPLQLTFGDRRVRTRIFRGEQGAFIDPDRAYELAKDVASTRLFQDAQGVNPDGLAEIRSRLLPRPRLEVSMPPRTGDERVRAASRLVPLPLAGRGKVRLFRLDDAENELLTLLNASRQPDESPSHDTNTLTEGLGWG